MIEDLHDVLEGAIKIVGASQDLPLVARCEAELGERLGVGASAMRSQPYYLDITHPEANKGMVVREAARLLRIPIEQIATIGDMANDLPMLSIARLSIAMGNAGAEVRSASRHVTSSNADDGFAHAVDSFILGEPPAARTALGLPPRARACLFDLEGVLAQTETLDAEAWKLLFEHYLRERARASGQPFVPFDSVRDYYRHFSAKPSPEDVRSDVREGVRSFLDSRDIELLVPTLQALTVRHGELLVELLEREHAETYEGSVRYVRAARAAGLRTAVVSSGTHCAETLRSAGIAELFDAWVDGRIALAEHRRGHAGTPDTLPRGRAGRRGRLRAGRGLRRRAHRRRRRPGRPLWLHRRRRPPRPRPRPAAPRRGRRRGRSRRASSGPRRARRAEPCTRQAWTPPPRTMNMKTTKMKTKAYDKELRGLQAELCKLQEWVKHTGHRAIIVFEGRDTAGKGGTIRALTERVSPRVFRVVAMPAPSDREKTQMYMQRYMAHFPAAGEIVVFDRSWYNRAGIEHVMGFCTKAQYEGFLEICPFVEKTIVDTGIQLIKLWLEVGQEEQERRMTARIDDPLRQWKLSPMDVESWPRWYEYSRARDRMLEATDTKHAPWYILRSDDKRRARLNGLSHILGLIPYKPVPRGKVKLPARWTKHRYDDQASLKGRRFVPDKYRG